MNITIKLIAPDKIEDILPFLQLLNENIPLATLEERLTAMQAANYACVGAYNDEELVGITGIWTLTKHYVGKHMEPDNVIILPEYRTYGVGKLLLNWIHEYAKQQGCVATELNCYVSNHKGIKFWLNLGYRIIGYHMQKTL